MPKLFHTLCCCFRPNAYKKSESSDYDAKSTGSGAGSLNQVTKCQLPSSVALGDSTGTDKTKTTVNNQKQRKKQQNTEGEILTGDNLVAATQNQPIAGIRQKSALLNDNFTVFNAATLNEQNKQKLKKFKEDFLLSRPHTSDHNKKCLIVDLDETLVHSSFKPVKNADFIIPVEIDNVVHQVYVLKRPHTDEFLDRVGSLFECVLFTASLSKYADPVADLLDKRGIFRSRLFREACVFYEGNYVKDLDRLGRDLDKVIIIDNSPASYAFHPANAIPVKTWFDDPHDNELLELIPFLEQLAESSNIYHVLGTGSIFSKDFRPQLFQLPQNMPQQLNLQQQLITQVSKESNNNNDPTNFVVVSSSSYSTSGSAISNPTTTTFTISIAKNNNGNSGGLNCSNTGKINNNNNNIRKSPQIKEYDSIRTDGLR